MKYRIERYGHTRFSAPVREHHFELRIAPWDDAGQRLTALELTVVPPATTGVHVDCFGNQVHRASLMTSHTEVAVRLVAEVETLLANPFDYQVVAPGRELEWVAGSLNQAPRLLDFLLCRSDRVPDLAALARDGLTPPDYAASRPAIANLRPTPGAAAGNTVGAPPRRDRAKRSEPAGHHASPSRRGAAPTGTDLAPKFGTAASRPVLAQLQGAMAWVEDAFEFDAEAETARPSLAELFEEGRGSSRDLAHLFVALARGWGFPARYVRGYLDPAYFEPDEDDPESKQLPQISHAWAEVLIPGAGWRGFDPARQLLADQTYIRVAIGRDADDCPTQRNTFKGEAQAQESEDRLEVQVLEDGS